VPTGITVKLGRVLAKRAHPLDRRIDNATGPTAKALAAMLNALAKAATAQP